MVQIRLYELIDCIEITMSTTPDNTSPAAEKVKTFPHAPGVYLMKDTAERVIYVGKAKDLRNHKITVLDNPAPP